MLRGSRYCAVAVRKENKIVTKVDPVSPLRLQKIPVLRGVLALIDMLILGINTLLWSAAQAEGEELSKKETATLFTTTIAIAIVFFIGIPLLITLMISPSHGVLFNLLDGSLRLGIFIGYVGIISRLEDVKKLFRYHGAEHKVVNCYEQVHHVTVNAAKKCSPIHPRCGTTFVMVILLLSVVVLSIINPSTWFGKFLVRIMMFPIIAGTSYEIIKLAANFRENILLKAIITPGLWFQTITTAEPTAEELEVAVAALNALVEKENA